MPLKPSRSYLISAGEFSGDLLAADLVHALRGEAPDFLPFGIAGETMLRAGVTPLANISELSVMGILEVAKRIVDIRMLEQRVLAWVDRTNPEFAVLVDFPGFHFRLAEQLYLRDIPVYQYVAPKVWAWGKKRVHQLRDNFAGVLGILPFEEEFFLQHGVRYTYVGSPHFDRIHKLVAQPEDVGFKTGQKIVAFLPGSRMSELKAILPVMLKVRQEIASREPETLCVIPLASGLKWEDVAPIVGQAGLAVDVTKGWQAAGFHWISGQSLELMKVAASAVVASGTATLECALAGTPMVVVYVMNEISFAIAKRAVDLKWVSLVNLLMNQEVVKEHLQQIDAVQVAGEVLEISVDTPARVQMKRHFDQLTSRLEPGASEKAAKLICADILQRRGLYD
jgi:lipid-A-disaccharide synthase